MKYFFVLLTFSLLASTSFAQAPLRFNYQAVIRNSNGTLVSTRPVGMRLSLLQGSATGPAVYVETQTITTNANGLATLEIGGGTVVSGSLATITWGGGLFFLKTETDPAGGTNYTITGTSQLLSVPYAIHATYAQFAGGHYVGELFGGGIVFSVWRDHLGVEHGLIASLDDLAPGFSWASPEISYTSSAQIAPNYNDGRPNTAAIVAVRPTGNAAAACVAYRGGNFSDWYLPAVREMNLLYAQLPAISAVLDNDNNPVTNGLNELLYWSSTSSYDSNASMPAALLKRFRSPTSSGEPGGWIGGRHTASVWVRAIRRF